VRPRADLLRDYRVAFLRHLTRREESALHAGYELGRKALEARFGVLDVVRVHHDVLIEVLRGSPAQEAPELAAAASDFLLEVLASYDMTQRGLPPAAD
jgi:S-adenosylmethionine:diacylglycerol 3-amino-3-carboxypropyl transferase